MKIVELEQLNTVRRAGLAKLRPGRPRIAVGLGTCGIGNGAEDVYQAFLSVIDAKGHDAVVTRTGCFGFCAEEPLVTVSIPGKPAVVLRRVKPQDAEKILDDIAKGVVSPSRALCRIDAWDHLSGAVKDGSGALTGVIDYGKGFDDIPVWDEIGFYKGQKKIVLRNAGIINPEDIEEYIAVGGYVAAFRAIREMKPEAVIDAVKNARLRGRGGAGFLTATKWDFMRRADSDVKYVVCNADEGDPGAYMNRNEIESDPHNLIEGMLIGAFAMGAGEGIIYVRAEYPLAVHRLERAIVQARELGLLGDDVMGSGFSFNLRLVEGAEPSSAARKRR